MRAIREAGEHLRSLLVYSVLTASTIGPGTVAMCAKSGSEYDTALLWCVLVAAAVAWAMQEGSARLTLASDRTLGQCLRALTATRPGLRVVRHLLLAFILVFLDDGITWHLINNPSHKLKHGDAYNYDTLVIALMIAVNSILGLPWLVESTTLFALPVLS